MDLYEVSKSGKSINKFTLQATEKMAEYKQSKIGDISLFQFETGDYSFMSKIRSLNLISLAELSSNKVINTHALLGNLNMDECRTYSEVKRLSPMYYYSLSERASLENVWLQYLEGTYPFSNLLSVYLGDKGLRMSYCNHLLLPESYEVMYPFDLDADVLSARTETMCPIYSMKNILDLPEDLYTVELLEQGKYQTISDLSLTVDPSVLSCYQWVDHDLYSIDVLEDESMSEIATTLDMQKSMLKTIRQNSPWKLK